MQTNEPKKQETKKPRNKKTNKQTKTKTRLHTPREGGQMQRVGSCFFSFSCFCLCVFFAFVFFGFLVFWFGYGWPLLMCQVELQDIVSGCRGVYVEETCVKNMQKLHRQGVPFWIYIYIYTYALYTDLYVHIQDSPYVLSFIFVLLAA